METQVMTQTTSNPSIKYSHDKIQEALLQVDDYFERALIPYMLFDDIALQVYEDTPKFEVDEISCGVLRKNWTQSGSSIFRMYVPKLEYLKTSVNFTANGVPVIVWIIDNSYQFLENPDSRPYYTADFKLPNPFKDYWKARDLIK